MASTQVPTPVDDGAGTQPETLAANAAAGSIDAGTYELLRKRLEVQAAELNRRAGALNDRRLEHFGATRLEPVGASRIRTENTCVPRDLAAAGATMLFGYNVFLGIRTETRVSDVFSLHHFEREAGDGAATTVGFSELASDHPDNWLSNEDFTRDFAELYTYYKQAELLMLRRIEGRLLAVFKIGEKLDDLRVFRWNISPAGTVEYLDDRGERDNVFPPSQDFDWILATRDDHRLGLHPHISILDEVFIETVGGDLTIKIEDNTEDGLGIYGEPVAEANQSLADADIHYARVGSLVLIKVRPYKEPEWRHFVFNTKTRTVARIDAIGAACQTLPEDQGIIFPGGYYLMSGETKSFPADTADMIFIQVIRSPNGEDVLYVFSEVAAGRSVLLSYNVIRKEVATPIWCHGFSRFEDGTIVIFQAESNDPTRVHPMQVWQTPYASAEHFATIDVGNTFFDTIGNAELVRAVSDALSVTRLVQGTTPSRVVYEDLLTAVSVLPDRYHWLSEIDAGNLLEPISELRSTGELIVDEFEKTEGQRQKAAEALTTADAALNELLRNIRVSGLDTVEKFVESLSSLRRQQGHLITLRELRYMDTERLGAIESGLVEEFDALAGRTIEFLGDKESFAPYHQRLIELGTAAETAATVVESEPVSESINTLTGDLELLTEVIGGLAIGDATVRTEILGSISEVLGGLNRTRAILENRRREMAGAEAIAEFGAEFLLFEQSITGSLAMASDPNGCDEQLAKLVLALESLEARFGEFEDFGEQLATKRDDVYEALTVRKQALLDERQRKGQRLADAGVRIVESIKKRVESFPDLDEINSFFASDQLVLRLRTIVTDLRQLEDSVRADELESRLKAAREDAARAWRDRSDIFEEGAEVLRLGRHRFSVNTQKPDLTMVPSETGIDILLTATDYRRPVTDAVFLAETHDYWNQLLPSEDPLVYRAEHLATSLLDDAIAGRSGLTLTDLHQSAASRTLIDLIHTRASARYDEAYERGVHDADTALILEKLLHLHSTAGLLRFGPAARSAAWVFWIFGADETLRRRWTERARSLIRLRTAFESVTGIHDLRHDLDEAITTWHGGAGLPLDPAASRQAGAYLLEEIGATEGPARFVISATGAELGQAFETSLVERNEKIPFAKALVELDDDLGARFALVNAWYDGFLTSVNEERRLLWSAGLAEATARTLVAERAEFSPTSALTTLTVDGLLGQHPNIKGGSLTIHFDEMLSRTEHFRTVQVPGFREYQRRRHELLQAERVNLRLSEFEPKVMSAFVRNRLIDQVYLPVIGDNLAKQLGALGDAKRTDQMGLLLLISPPGYGKTTLMEYVANRLGLVFVKINGPALGHEVTSIDPDEAPNATARQEVNKVNFALEMGNNVLLYVDDIQHTNPEFLQKFISMTDAQRRMEGVWEGKTRTYDLRGKRFAVCMAGNPYTESGDKFQIPDMLANRADTYNLGDMLSGSESLFELSYIENSLTSNTTLAPLTTHAPDDVGLLVRMARGEPVQADQLEHPWSGAELEEILSVLRKMGRVQEVLLKVNQLYISSAATDDAFRTEPRFQLQGSYRNMNKLAEKVVAVMNDDELEALIDDHYLGESQTLTGGAEWNQLRLRELRGVLTESEATRINDIRVSFQRRQALGGEEVDPMMKVVLQLGVIGEGLETLSDGLTATQVESAARDVRRSKEVAEAQASRDQLATELATTLETARIEAAGLVAVAQAQLEAAHSASQADQAALRAEAEGERWRAQEAIESARSQLTTAFTQVEAARQMAETEQQRMLAETAVERLSAISQQLGAMVEAISGLTPVTAPSSLPSPPSSPPDSTAMEDHQFFTAYLSEDDIDFYWEVGADGYAVRQVEVRRATGQALAAASLDEWRMQGNAGVLGQAGEEVTFTQKALDPADPSVATRPISPEAFLNHWTWARAQLES